LTASIAGVIVWVALLLPLRCSLDSNCEFASRVELNSASPLEQVTGTILGLPERVTEVAPQCESLVQVTHLSPVPHGLSSLPPTSQCEIAVRRFSLALTGCFL
jgi:hypothetical protein